MIEAWGLVSPDGTFIAAFRFKPKKVWQGDKEEGYYTWTDCNGPVPHPHIEGCSGNSIEGSMNAICIPIKISIANPNQKKEWVARKYADKSLCPRCHKPRDSKYRKCLKCHKEMLVYQNKKRKNKRV